MTAVVSCHLDAPGWTGYKFQLQTMSYPRSRLTSQLTGGDCSVRLPSLPPPHDWACGGAGQPPSPDRSPDFDLVLQTPGSALAAGVVVGELGCGCEVCQPSLCRGFTLGRVDTALCCSDVHTTSHLVSPARIFVPQYVPPDLTCI